MSDNGRWRSPSDPLPPYCYWCTMDGHTFAECPERRARDVLDHYQARSAAFYQLWSEGFSDPLEPPLTSEERALVEDAMRVLGVAIEGEVFGDKPARTGSSPDDL